MAYHNTPESSVNNSLSFQHSGQEGGDLHLRHDDDARGRDDDRPRHNEDTLGRDDDDLRHDNDNDHRTDEPPGLMEVNDSLTNDHSETEHDIYGSDSDSDDSVVDEIEDYDLLDPDDDFAEHAPRGRPSMVASGSP